MDCCQYNKNLQQNKEKKTCPLCKSLSSFIHYAIVEGLVKDEIKKYVMEEKYFCCSNDVCDVVFFNEEGKTIFLLQDVKKVFDDIKKTNCSNDCNRCHKIVNNEE